jgi:hypothetical protein
VISALFRLARALAWGRAIGRAAGGRPGSLAKRVRNRAILTRIGPWLRK